MSVEEIKKELAGRSEKDLADVTAFLFHLRRISNEHYQKTVAERLDDRDSSHWLTPKEFERRLDEK